MAELHHEAATPAHAEELLAQLRPADRDEVEAASGNVERVVRQSLAVSDDPIAARDPNGGLIAIYGVAPVNLLSDQASPWLLGTARMQTNAKAVLRDAREYLAFARERYPRMMNYVDARNRSSIRWLRKVGFTLEPAAPFGVQGLPFHRFHSGFDNV